MRLILVRHGDPDYENDCITPLGNLQAKAASERLKDEGISGICSSSCGRALETAQYTADLLGLRIEKFDFLREISWGSEDGTEILKNGHPWHVSDQMVEDNASLFEGYENYFANNRISRYIEKSAEDIDNWLSGFGYKREGHFYRNTGAATDKTIAVFGHGGIFTLLLSRLFNIPYPFVFQAIRMDMTSVTVISFSDEPGKLVSPRFEILADARHIKDIKEENVYGF